MRALCGLRWFEYHTHTHIHQAKNIGGKGQFRTAISSCPIRKTPAPQILLHSPFPKREYFVLRARPLLTANMHSYVQFVSTPSADTGGTALLLHFDQRRYLLGNIHEGLSRALMEKRERFGDVAGIFVTGKTEWKNVGGLLGILLAAAGHRISSELNKPIRLRKKTTLTVHGGKNLCHALATGRRFIFKKGLPIKVKEYTGEKGREGLSRDWKPDFTDPFIKVWALAIEPSCPEMTTTSATSQSPRKRTFDDYITEASPDADSMDADQRVRENVISEMFDSNWNYNDLKESLLADVQMPAAIFIRDGHGIKRYHGPTPDGILPVPHLKVLSRKPWPAVVLQDLPSTKPSNKALSYIVQCHRQRGRFLPEIATLLSVPAGPLRTQLSQGFDVVSTEGKTIKPEMVLEKSKDDGGMVVADLPSQEYVRGFLDRPEWQATELMTGIEAFIWILGPGVGQNKGLQSFIHDRKHLKHLFSSPDLSLNRLTFHNSARMSTCLNWIDPPRHPIPLHENVTLPQEGQPNAENDWTPRSQQFANVGLRLQFRPALTIKTNLVSPSFNAAQLVRRMSPSIKKLAEKARAEISSEFVQTALADQDLPSPDAEVVFLGTGSSMPSKTRNVSGTLLRLPGVGSYLLDCGENTLGQLKRLYSPAELGMVLRDLKLIWISHLHADHITGTISVIKAWYEEVYGQEIATGRFSTNSQHQEFGDAAKLLRHHKPLCVVGHAYMLAWLHEYAAIEDFGLNRLACVKSSPAPLYVTPLECNGKPLKLDEPNELYVRPDLCFFDEV